jgi:hypothetical protein
MRDLHDPSLHLKTIEDELKGTIGKALGKQGEKILMYARLMHTEREKYEELLLEKQNGKDRQDDIQNCIERHNQYRKDCIHARWELIVHRQAAGFIVGNHQYVTEKFPIADALPPDVVVVPTMMGDHGEDGRNGSGRCGAASGSSSTTTTPSSSKEENHPKMKQFGDQLDWWQRVGRWR